MYTINTLELFQALDAGKYCMAKPKAGHPQLCAMHFQGKGDHILITSIDAHHMMQSSIRVLDLGDFHGEFTLPADAVSDWITKTKHKKGWCSIELQDGAVRLVSGDWNGLYKQVPDSLVFPDPAQFLAKVDYYDKQETTPNGVWYKANTFALLGKLTKYCNILEVRGAMTDDMKQPIRITGKTVDTYRPVIILSMKVEPPKQDM